MHQDTATTWIDCVSMKVRNFEVASVLTFPFLLSVFQQCFHHYVHILAVTYRTFHFYIIQSPSCLILLIHMIHSSCCFLYECVEDGQSSGTPGSPLVALDNGIDERGNESRRSTQRQITVSITCVLESVKSLRMKRYERGTLISPVLNVTRNLN